MIHFTKLANLTPKISQLLLRKPMLKSKNIIFN